MDRLRVSALTSVGLGVAAALFGVGVVQAQAPAPAPAAPGAQAPPAATDQSAAPADQGEGALQEVVVTAERRTEDVQTTPISIQAMSQDQLASDDVTHIKNLQLYTPSLTVLDDGLYQAPNIRGIGNSAIIPNVTTGVAVLVDGLFTPEPHGLDEPFYDMQDTEVLRGPQGTFVGYSSTGGAIEINSANPNFRGTNGYLELTVGNYTDKRLDGAVNYVLSDTFAVRLAFNEEQMGSFYRDDGSLVIPGEAEPIQDPGSTDNKDMRLSMLWKPTDNLTALLKLDYNSSNDGGDPSQVNQASYTVPAGTACPYGSPTLPGPNGGSTCYSEYYNYSSHSPYVLNWGPQMYLLPQLGHPYYNYRLGLHLDYTFGGGFDLRSVTGFQQTQYDTFGNTNSIPQSVTYATPAGCSVALGTCTGSVSQNVDSEGAGYQWIPKDDYYSEEVDIISPTTGPFWSKVNFIAGATWFYRDTGVTVYSVTTDPPLYSIAQPQVVGINEDDLNRIAGTFAQVSWQMTNTLQWQIGARENWDNNPTRASVYEVAIPGIIPATAPDSGCTGAYMTGIKFLPSTTGYYCVPAVDQSTAFQDKVPTGKIDLNWTPWQGQLFYGFFARGYKAGGAQPAAPNFQPEHVNDWEAGWKGTFGNWLTASLGGYYMDYQGMQQSLTTVSTLTGSGYVTNIGNSTLEGIETQMNARLGGLGVNFNASYEHSALGSISGIVQTYELPSTARGGECGLAGVPAADCFNYYPYATTLSGESNVFSPQLQGTIGVDYRLHVGQGVIDPSISYSYTGGQYASFFEIPYYYMGARHIWNAALTYDINQWDTEFYINNFTNETYLSGIEGATVYYGAPMQLGIRVKRDF